MIRRLGIIGVGLIGGSLARALRQAGEVEEVIGCGRGGANLAKAVELGVIDRWTRDPAAAVRDADMVVVAVPLGALQATFAAIRGGLGADTVLTDVGSAKQCVLEAAREAFGELPGQLVPGHPIAGAERSGVEASSAGLFQGRKVILCPHERGRPQALAAVREMWQTVGAAVVEMDPVHHDEVLAATSHLPHVLAYVLVDVLGRMEERREIFAYAAGGFRDFTRIASSDPGMWHDILMANRDAILPALELFQTDLAEVTAALRRADSDTLCAVFNRAKELRDRFDPQQS